MAVGLGGLPRVAILFISFLPRVNLSIGAKKKPCRLIYPQGLVQVSLQGVSIILFLLFGLLGAVLCVVDCSILESQILFCGQVYSCSIKRLPLPDDPYIRNAPSV